MAERVVFDTNIWISGLMWRGKPYQCLLLARTGVVQALYCQEIVAELTHKLRQVFGFSENHIRAVAHDLRRMGEKAEITGDLRVVARDPNDDKFVECAVIGRAAVVVSGDHHLLDLDEYQGIRILAAAEFIAHFTESEGIVEEE